MDFWDRVDELIKQENTSYAYIAKKLGKSESTVSGWHREGAKHRIPEADFAVIIAKILKTTVEYLVSGKEDAQIAPNISPEALKIARMYDKLDGEAQDAVTISIEALMLVHKRPPGEGQAAGGHNPPEAVR
jgi:transcriptional regulator with XRE-family HTH domain